MWPCTLTWFVYTNGSTSWEGSKIRILLYTKHVIKLRLNQNAKIQGFSRIQGACGDPDMQINVSNAKINAKLLQATLWTRPDEQVLANYWISHEAMFASVWHLRGHLGWHGRWLLMLSVNYMMLCCWLGYFSDAWFELVVILITCCQNILPGVHDSVMSF